MGIKTKKQAIRSGERTTGSSWSCGCAVWLSLNVWRFILYFPDLKEFLKTADANASAVFFGGEEDRKSVTGLTHCFSNMALFNSPFEYGLNQGASMS